MSGRGQRPTSESGGPRARQVEAEKSRLTKRLTSISLHRKALELAISEEFPDGFTEETWRKAFESEDPRDANRCVVVAGGYSTITNALAEMIRSAVSQRLLGLLEFRKPQAGDAINAVREDGGISAEQADVLNQLYLLEGRLEHLSPDVSAEEVFEAVELLRAELPGLVASVRDWLDGHGISFS